MIPAEPYLAPLPLVAAAATLLWLLSLALRDAGIVDVFWGLGFVALAYFYSSRGGPADARTLVTLVLVSVWGLRLTAHIALRNRGRGEDRRYAAMRTRWGSWFPLVSLFTVFLLQALLLWIISAPLFVATQAQAPAGPVEWTDGVGIGLVVLGLFLETVADFQLVRFKLVPENHGRVLDTGLWRYSRHPNYFGDFLVWWGFFALALGRPAAIWTIVSPILMSVLLLRISGIRMLEKNLERSKPDYRHYTDKTSAFFPWFTR